MAQTQITTRSAAGNKTATWCLSRRSNQQEREATTQAQRCTARQAGELPEPTLQPLLNESRSEELGRDGVECAWVASWVGRRHIQHDDVKLHHTLAICGMPTKVLSVHMWYLMSQDP